MGLDIPSAAGLKAGVLTGFTWSTGASMIGTITRSILGWAPGRRTYNSKRIKWNRPGFHVGLTLAEHTILSYRNKEATKKAREIEAEIIEVTDEE
jgi:hypothetical protein